MRVEETFIGYDKITQPERFGKFGVFVKIIKCFDGTYFREGITCVDGVMQNFILPISELRAEELMRAAEEMTLSND